MKWGKTVVIDNNSNQKKIEVEFVRLLQALSSPPKISKKYNKIKV